MSPLQYPSEQFTPTESAVLARHFTNLDQPVFGLVNLPETVKGALFARYSRYGGTLRRLFLDEFADSLEEGDHKSWDGKEGKRAAQLYDRIFLGFGDDSVAQLGGAHVACEWVSNVATKILQRPRLAAYLEQSTRYIAYDSPLPTGGYRYYNSSELSPNYARTLDELFEIYSDALPRLRAWLDGTFPVDDAENAGARSRAIKAKALDLLRGLLPAASLSHMGIYATGQSYEQLILHLLAHPLPEARFYGQGLLDAVKAIMPSFVTRVERPDRGGRWIEYLAQRRRSEEKWTEKLGLSDRAIAGRDEASVQLLSIEGDENKLIAALLFEAGCASEVRALEVAAQLNDHQRKQLLNDLVGERANRRHKPGRGFEALRYRFEIVSDYGAFRDLQRHRLLTVQWQQLTPDLGAYIPDEIAAAGLDAQYNRALELSRSEYERLRDQGHHDEAPYALCLAYRIRYILDLNAREAMHLIELRSGREGHKTYRDVAHQMYEQIAAHHPGVAAAIKHVDHSSEPRLERMSSELRQQQRALSKNE